MYKFIYVFDKETKNLLISYGCKLLKSSDDSDMYIFENKPDLNLSNIESAFVYSNTLTF